MNYTEIKYQFQYINSGKMNVIQYQMFELRIFGIHSDSAESEALPKLCHYYTVIKDILHQDHQCPHHFSYKAKYQLQYINNIIYNS